MKILDQFEELLYIHLNNEIITLVPENMHRRTEFKKCCSGKGDVEMGS